MNSLKRFRFRKHRLRDVKGCSTLRFYRRSQLPRKASLWPDLYHWFDFGRRDSIARLGAGAIWAWRSIPEQYRVASRVEFPVQGVSAALGTRGLPHQRFPSVWWLWWLFRFVDVHLTISQAIYEKLAKSDALWHLLGENGGGQSFGEHRPPQYQKKCSSYWNLWMFRGNTLSSEPNLESELDRALLIISNINPFLF